MKIIFGVQSEGAGHCTQAIAMKQYLNKRGHDVKLIFAAKKDIDFPTYVKDEFNIIPYNGFDFVFDKVGKMIVWKTLLKNLCKLPILIYSFIKMCETIRNEKPDVIFNFYDPAVGLTALFFPNIKYISVGHQYAMTLDSYPKINGFNIQKIALYIINKITSIKSTQLALSYYEFNSGNDKIIPCPPILRDESYITSTNKEEFILVYLMNAKLVSRLIEHSRKHPDTKIECFSKFKNDDERRMLEKSAPPNVKLFQLNSKLFQAKMRVCRAVVCSGGFETTSEAIVQNKPILMVPLPNHFEQYANCNDAEKHSLARWNSEIDVDMILSTLPASNSDREWFLTVNKILDSTLQL